MKTYDCMEGESLLTDGALKKYVIIKSMESFDWYSFSV